MHLQAAEDFCKRYNEDSSQLHLRLLKHIVCLYWIDIESEHDGMSGDKSDSDPKDFAVSTFVVSVKNRWFLVTAGHILIDLQSRLDSGRRIWKSRLIAGSTSNPSESIPFNLEDTPRWHIHEDGLDYAVIQLRRGFVDPLSADGIHPLKEIHWKDYPKNADEYVLLGFPTQAQNLPFTSSEKHTNINITLGCPMLPVFPISDPPSALKCKHERFYAKVPLDKDMFDNSTNVRLTDIAGMSGGPIFVIKWIDDQNLEYWIKAVQSGWHKTKRILAACPIHPLVNRIEKLIDKHLESTDEYTS